MIISKTQIERDIVNLVIYRADGNVTEQMFSAKPPGQSGIKVETIDFEGGELDPVTAAMNVKTVLAYGDGPGGLYDLYSFYLVDCIAQLEFWLSGDKQLRVSTASKEGILNELPNAELLIGYNVDWDYLDTLPDGPVEEEEAHWEQVSQPGGFWTGTHTTVMVGGTATNTVTFSNWADLAAAQEMPNQVEEEAIPEPPDDTQAAFQVAPPPEPDLYNPVWEDGYYLQ